MNKLQKLMGAAVLVTSAPVWAAAVFVQHLGDVDTSPVTTFASGLGYMLGADLLSGEFKIFADASPDVPANNNFAGMFRPLEFTNLTGATIIIPHATPATAPGGPTGLQAQVHADMIAGPPAGTATGGSSNTNMRVSGNLFARVLGGSGQGDFLAIGFYQETVIFNVDGTVRQFIPDFESTERNGATVFLGGGGGISVNMSLLMPELVLDPGARLQLSFVLGGDASDSSTTDAFNTALLSFTLPEDAILANDVGLPLSWVTNAAPDAASVPEPGTFAMMALGLAVVATRFGFSGRTKSTRG